ncbi:reverse transcriptase domain-containing protein [Tanacetum coccineum]
MGITSISLYSSGVLALVKILLKKKVSHFTPSSPKLFQASIGIWMESHPNQVQDENHPFTQTKRAKRFSVWKDMNEVFYVIARCLLAPVIVHPIRNSSDNSFVSLEHQLNSGSDSGSGSGGGGGGGCNGSGGGDGGGGGGSGGSGGDDSSRSSGRSSSGCSSGGDSSNFIGQSIVIRIALIRANNLCVPNHTLALKVRVLIIPPRMTTRSAGWPAAVSRGGGKGGRAGRGGGRTGGDQGRGQGNNRNQNGDAINDNIRSDVRNVIENNDHSGCTYKEFLACYPKEYDGKGGVVYTRWIEKMDSVQDMSGCMDNQKGKYTAGSFVGKALIWWNSQIRTLGREVAVGMSWDNFKVLMREEFCPSNEMQKLETKLWNHTMVGAGHAAYSDKFHELARLVPHLVTLENRRIERYLYGLAV